MEFRKARMEDAPIIQKLIEEGGKENLLLPRSLSEIYEKIRDFWVVCESGKVVGCCALHPVWENLAEIRSLVVKKGWRSKGIGRRLVEKSIEEAKSLGIEKVFVLTSIPHYFEKMGFRKIPKENLPHKVWKDCLQCPYFPNCKEESLIRDL